MIIFCDECPEYNILDEELDGGPNASFVHFSVYTYHGRFVTRGIILNGPTLCIICEENDDIKNGLIKRQTYGKNKPLTKISCYIGKFNMVNYQPMLKKYVYHSMLLCLLGKQ